MTGKQVKISKSVSYALRHRPDEFGLKLDAEGWVDIETLTKAVSGNLHFAIGREDLEDIIAASEKKRFEIEGDRIRATYGHSFEGKIEFNPVEPPEVLYHGTSERAWEAIKQEGLKPMNRQYVHLSSDVQTARKVGLRHDSRPVILVVDARQMYADGWKFYHSGNDGTWMCEHVPKQYIKSPAVTGISRRGFCKGLLTSCIAGIALSQLAKPMAGCDLGKGDSQVGVLQFKDGHLFVVSEVWFNEEEQLRFEQMEAILDKRGMGRSSPNGGGCFLTVSAHELKPNAVERRHQQRIAK